MGGDTDEGKLARGIDALIDSIFISGPIPVVTVMSGITSAATAILIALEPKDRILILSQMVDAMLQGFNSHPVADLVN